MNELLKSLFFVRTCLGCGTALPDAGKDTVFCPECFRLYSQLRSEECLHCEKRMDKCRCVPENLRGKVGWSAHLFSYYGKLSRQIIFTLKMKNYLPLQRFLSAELAALILEATGGDLSDYTVTFAPRKPGSVCVYGFDQAKILAKMTAARLDLPVEHMFGHTYFSKTQKRLKAFERKKNAKNSYFLKKHACRRTDKLLIFDDIITTGSTLAVLVSLAEALGYREIAVVSVAKAL
ncbi:MAG: ComF family protein [Ruminococcaceae bacterium]|nr:ComF family protein [Oscillospiraceae bacterium]